MKYVFLILFLFAFQARLLAQADQTISVIPEPVSVQKGVGHNSLKSTTAIITNSTDSDAVRVVQFLAEKLRRSTGFSIPIHNITKKGSSRDVINLDISPDSSLSKEGYRLLVDANTIKIQAASANGLFYGTQTLLQLLPKEIESKTIVSNITWNIPAVTVFDKPRFGWRGLMFDVVRHFFTKEEVKSFIDNMVRYKFNMLHLHLTDDQGWRIQIKSLPRLTEVGAWRVKREGKWGNSTAPDSTEPKTYGGFYTQDDVRELVKYAADRFVQILPEVDVPGHSMAAVASYPELSCTAGTYRVNAGEKFMNWYGGGKFSAIIDNTLCPAKEIVYTFLDSVFTEIAQIFPFPYIHMGGDEAAKNFWEVSDTVKALMKTDSLENPERVQSYFVHRVEKIIKSKGKRMIGWDEILEGGLAPDATVMSWRGLKGGIAAAKMNHSVVMTPNDFAYLDYMQGDKIIEPNVYASLRLNKTYQFNPLPDGVDSTLILGGQGNLWTEQITNMRAVQYMLWPRGLALAESVWSPVAAKNYDNFIQKTEKEFERLDVLKVKYSRSMYEPIFSASYEGKMLKVKLETEIKGLDIFYSFDETNPDEFYPKYTSTLTVPKDALTLKVVTYRDGKQVGRQINMPIAELEKRAGKK